MLKNTGKGETMNPQDTPMTDTTNKPMPDYFAASLDIAEMVFDMIKHEDHGSFCSMDRHAVAKAVESKIADLMPQTAQPEQTKRILAMRGGFERILAVQPLSFDSQEQFGEGIRQLNKALLDWFINYADEIRAALMAYGGETPKEDDNTLPDLPDGWSYDWFIPRGSKRLEWDCKVGQGMRCDPEFGIGATPRAAALDALSRIQTTKTGE